MHCLQTLQTGRNVRYPDVRRLRKGGTRHMPSSLSFRGMSAENYRMHIVCISYAYRMHIVCISYAYRMHIVCISYAYRNNIVYISYATMNMLRFRETRTPGIRQCALSDDSGAYMTILTSNISISIVDICTLISYENYKHCLL